HTAGVALDRSVDEALHAGERDHLVEAAADFCPLHAENCSVQVDVLAASQLRMEAGANLQQTADTTTYFGATLGRLGNPRQDLQQRALACSVVADNSQDFARCNLERDVAQGPDGVVDRCRTLRAQAAQRCGYRVGQGVAQG